jgi:hypothetical protein
MLLSGGDVKVGETSQLAQLKKRYIFNSYLGNKYAG